MWVSCYLVEKIRPVYVRVKNEPGDSRVCDFFISFSLFLLWLLRRRTWNVPWKLQMKKCVQYTSLIEGYLAGWAMSVGLSGINSRNPMGRLEVRRVFVSRLRQKSGLMYPVHKKRGPALNFNHVASQIVISLSIYFARFVSYFWLTHVSLAASVWCVSSFWMSSSHYICRFFPAQV